MQAIQHTFSPAAWSFVQYEAASYAGFYDLERRYPLDAAAIDRDYVCHRMRGTIRALMRGLPESHFLIHLDDLAMKAAALRHDQLRGRVAVITLRAELEKMARSNGESADLKCVWDRFRDTNGHKCLMAKQADGGVQ